MKARVLTQVAAAFLMGILGACYQKPGHILAVLVVLAVWWNISHGYRRTLCCVGFCLAAALLGGWRWQVQQSLFEEVEEQFNEGETVTLVGTVSKKEEKNQQLIYYVENSYLSVERGWQYAGSGLVYLKDDAFIIGDTLKVQGKYREFQSARNEGNFDRKSYYHGKNLAFQVKADTVEDMAEISETVILPGQALDIRLGKWKEWLYQLRKKVLSVYQQCMNQDQAGVLAVMTLGDKGSLEPESKELYQKAGISHVLAISGLHISLLGMGLFGILRKAGCPYGISGAVAGILLVCFGQMAGMEISTGRAVLMFLVMLLGHWLGMAYDTLTALSLSALLQLWDNPAALWYAGFQFSYAAVLAVVVVSRIYRNLLPLHAAGEKEERGSRFLEKMRGWIGSIGETLLVSGCIQLVTLPLTLWYYYEFPLYTVLVNGILLPLMGVILFLGILGGSVGLFLPGLSWIFLKLPGLLLWWNEAVCRLFLQLPFAQMVTGRPQWWQMCLYYAVLGICLWLLWYRGQMLKTEVMETGNRKEVTGPGDLKEAVEKRKTRGRLLGKKTVGVVLGMIPVAGLLWMIAVPKEAEFQMTFLDVGQGDGIYLETPEGTDFFIDGGSSDVTGVGEYRILGFLKYHGVKEIDGWFVSHADKDHISGLLEVWGSGYPIRQLFLAEGMVRDEAWKELIDSAAEHGTAVLYLSPGQRVVSGELSFTCLGPEPDENGDDRNAASLVLLAECQGVRTLLNGDISREEERKLLEKYQNLQVDVYKAAHHGSNYSNDGEFLEILKPLVSVVSCSEKNRYGHPGEEAVAHMEAVGSEIFYTMDSGQVTVSGSRDKFLVQEFLKE